MGSFIGTEAATRIFVKDKVGELKEDIEALVKIAKSDPQLAYSAYVYSVAPTPVFFYRKIADQLRIKKPHQNPGNVFHLPRGGYGYALLYNSPPVKDAFNKIMKQQR